MKDRVAKSVFWIFWSRGVVQALSFATTMVVARWLDPSDYGLMALAGTFIAVLAIVCELGLGAAVVQFADLERRELNLCFVLGVALASTIYAILFVAAPMIAAWFTSPRLAEVLRVAALVLPLGALAIVPQGVIQRELRLDQATKAEMAGALASLVVVFVLAWRGAGVWALVGGSLARVLVLDAALYCYSPWLPGLAVGSPRARRILGFSIGTFVSRAVWSIYYQSDSFVLGKVAGAATLGFYTMARDLANIPVTRVSTVVNQLSIPLMASLQDTPSQMRAMLLRGLRLTATVSVPMCVGIALVAEDLVHVALSAKWLSIVPVLRILCGTALVRSLDVLVAPVLRARYRTTFLAGYNVVLLVVMPLVFLAGAKLDGGVGVAWGWLAIYPLVMTRMASEAFREIDLRWPTVLEQLRLPAIAALLMVPAVLGAQTLIHGDGTAISLARLLVAACAGAAVYAGVLWSWGGALREEMLEIFAWVFRPRRHKA